jgi:hypothetical protein
MGERMIAKTLRSQVIPAFLAGTSRQPLRLQGELAALAADDPAGAALKALSLAGQALRFERPPAPPSFAVEEPVPDHRPILPNHLRRALLRLLGNKRPSDDLALALAWAFGRFKVRPHPFDLPRIDAFVRAHAEHLGPAAQQWAAQQTDSPAEPRGYFDGDDLDETNWTKSTPARRARFIADLRRKDAAAARALVEPVFAQESADDRVRLLTALETGLSPADQPFFESLAKDRAPRVRSLAQRLLARITGHSGDHPALAACLERIRRSTTGLLRKRTALALELPATVKEHEAKGWIRSTFSEVSCEELARALQLTETEMIDAAEKDANLSLAFAIMATQDRRFDLLEQLTAAQLADAWEQLSLCGPLDLEVMTAGERQRWAAILIRPCGAKPPAQQFAWSWLHRALEGPAPDLLVESVLRSPGWLYKLLEEGKAGAEWLELLAAICPPSPRPRLRSLLGMLDPSLTLTALPLLDIVETIEKVGHHEQ